MFSMTRVSLRLHHLLRPRSGTHGLVILHPRCACIDFEPEGPAKQPYVPHETVRIEVEFGLPHGDGSEPAASV